MKNIIFLIFSVVLFLFSCNRDMQVNDSFLGEEPKNFYSGVVDEYNIVGLPKSERIAFEKSKGYKSFATKSEEVFFSIDFENIKSMEDIYNILDENSKYIELIVDRYGDTILLPKLYHTTKKYYLDENLQKLDFFKGINENDIPFYNGYSDKTDLSDQTSPTKQRAGAKVYMGCGTSFENSKVDGRDKAVAGYNFTIKKGSGTANRIDWIVYCDNYKKVLLVWILGFEAHTIEINFNGKAWYFVDVPNSYISFSPVKTLFADAWFGVAGTKTVSGSFHIPLSPTSFPDLMILSQSMFYINSRAVGDVVYDVCNKKLALLEFILNPLGFTVLAEFD